MQQPQTYADLFTPAPQSMGLRGDPYLWANLREWLGSNPLPSTYSEFTHRLEVAFILLTGKTIADEGNVYIERYAHGGMSSGHISLEFWQRKGFPLLCQRFGRHFRFD